MIKNIEGIIDRCGASLVGHGDHGFHVLLTSTTTIYCLPEAREAYGTVHGRPSNSNDSLVALTRAGDHVTFEVDGIRARAGTFRNWTLEARLLGHPEHDVTPQNGATALTSLRPAPAIES
jgi:hypothetical protein